MKKTSPLEIDDLNLDKECQRQAKLFMTYALRLAHARNDIAEAKAEMDLVEAELSHAIRAKPLKFGIPKFTEQALKLAITLQQEYQDCLRALNRAKHAADVLEAYCDALEHKKKSLDNMVYLQGQNYFSTPKSLNNVPEAVREIRKKRVRRPNGG